MMKGKVVNFTEEQWGKLIDIFLNAHKSRRLSWLSLLKYISVNELSKDEKNDVAYTMYSLFKDNIKEEKDD